MKTSITILIAFCFILFEGCGSKIDEVYELKELGLKKQALEKLDEILKDDPKNAEAYFAKANIQTEERLYTNARQSFEDALKIEPDNRRYNFHYFFLQYILSENNKNYYIDEIDKFIKKFPDNVEGYVIKARNYQNQDLSGYLKILLRINEIFPLADWEKLNLYPAKSFLVISDSTRYYDELNKLVGYLKKNEEIEINERKNDTLIYWDTKAYVISKRNAWKVIDGYRVQDRSSSKINIYDYNTLYEWPGFADGWYTHSEDRYGKDIRTKISPKVLSSVIEDGPIVSTGKTEIYRYDAYTNVYYTFNWAQVSYNTRKYLSRRIPRNDDIVLFRSNTTLTTFKNEIKNSQNKNLLKSILEAGNIAKNMTVDLLYQKITPNLEKFEFNKNDIKEYYQDDKYEFIFTDGLLTGIKLQNK